MKKFFIAILISSLFVVSFGIDKIDYVSAMSSSAKSMCVIEQDSGRIMYSKNENQCLPMASTTKIITALTVLNHCNDLTELVAVDDKAIGVSGTSIYLQKGEVLSVKDLLYGLMLRSGNDAATALAIKIGGSVENFANLMNDISSSMNLKNSHFSNPHGLDDSNHYTSAYDLAVITARALKNPIFKTIVSTTNYVIEKTNKSEKRYLTNKNKLLNSLDGCCGVKTGFTSKAGRCLVSACERDNTNYICVVLNCGPMFEESSYLLNSVFSKYSNYKILDKDKEIYNEYIIDENHGRLYLYVNEDFYYPISSAEKNDIVLKYKVEILDAEVGDEIGEIQVFFKNHLIKVAKLYTMNKLDKIDTNGILQSSKLLWEEKINEN